MIRPVRILFTALSLITFSSAVMAVDGVIEINQVKAIAGGVTDIDEPGFPVRIGNGGSFRLTSDLTVADENTRAVDLESNHITLDLNGFSIIGPNTCTGSGSSLTCTTAGTETLVRVAGQNITIRNGTIRGSAATGINQFGNIGPTVLESLTVIHSAKEGADFGTDVNDQIIITNCRFIRNFGVGIGLEGDGAQITNSVFSHNQGNGIGIANGRAHLVRDSQVKGNGSSGISIEGAGSEAHLFLSNIITDNADLGVKAAAGTAYSYGGNQIDGNANGTVNGIAIEVSTNVCNGNTACP